MRILHVLGKLDRGGVETWLVQVLRYIDRQKYQMDFLVHDPNPGAYDEEVRALGARIIPCLDYRNPARYALNFWRTLREYGPYDCVHSHVHSYSGYVLMLAKVAGVPLRIAHSHSNTTLGASSSGPARKTYRAAMGFLIRCFANGGLAVSTEAGDDLFGRPWQPSAKWNLQHLGIDLSRFEAEVDRDAVRRDLGIAQDAIVIGHVGRFSEEKNHAFVVEIAREVIRHEPRAVFLLVGDGPLRQRIEKTVADNSLRGRFVFTGSRADVHRLMKGAMDIFILPSLREGLPIALLEAQAAGLRCVISDVISPEADVIPEMVFRESPNASARRWAERLLPQLYELGRMSFDETRHHLRGRTITASTEQLSSVYANLSQT